MSNKTTELMLGKLNETNKNIELITKDIEKLAKVISEKISSEGRIIFIGAGLSSEMARIIIDELWFNFQIVKQKFITLTAAKSYIENTDKWKELEEVPSASVFELDEIGLNNKDIVIGLSSSGRTQYVVSGVKYAKDLGCTTASITDTDKTIIGEYSDYIINTKFGLPPIIGLNSAEGGTTQKIILDLLIYNAMAFSGRIYKNSLVFMQPVSEKIRSYCIETLIKLFDVNIAEAEKLLKTSDDRLEIAIIRQSKNCTVKEAQKILVDNNYDFNKIM